ncbi:MAG: hypothetical protein VW455_13785 [Nitrospinota bacterium]
MDDKQLKKTHWSFWVSGAITLLFNIMGVLNFFVQMDPESLAAFPEHYRPIIEGRPAWATAAFALSVFGASLGCVLLLLKKAFALHVFYASLLGVVASMMHIFLVAGFSSFEVWIGVLIQLIVNAFLIWYSKLTENKGWLG